jgi:multidrug efflux pump subunit AcrA (membrane-fusion protein)
MNTFGKIALPLAAMLGLIFAIYTAASSGKAPAGADPVALPAQSPFAKKVAGAGLVEANTENIAVGTPVAGVVAQVFAVVGQQVKKGGPLFAIDSRDLEAELLVRQADLKTRQANVKVAMASAADAQNQYDMYRAIGDKRAVTREELDRRRFAADVASASVVQAQAQVAAAQAAIAQTQVALDRCIVRAPVDGQVLQARIRLGEFAPTGAAAEPLMLLGNTHPLHVRVDIDENDAWRVKPTARAVATVRGNSSLSTPLKFVRIEPYVIPKRSLTGDSMERVDTRVLQVIYSFEPSSLKNVYVGQQMDVFIEDLGPDSASAPATVAKP